MLFSGEELVFIGPGSEWFWTTVGSIVTAVSLIAIFRQLRLQRSAEAIEQTDSFMREFFSERILRHQLAILVDLRDGVEPALLPLGSIAPIANYLAKIGTLARKGHLDLTLLEGASPMCQAWWATLAPAVRHVRAELGTPTMFGDFEWLTHKFAEGNARAGTTTRFDEAYVTSSLARRIALSEEMIRIEQELRTVLMTSPEGPTSAAPGRPAPDLPAPPASTDG